MTYKLTVTVDIHKLGESRIAARSPKLGLTAYGETDEEAIDNYTKLMLSVLNHKEHPEAIESYLDRHGIDWWSADNDSDPPPAPQFVDRGTKGRGAFLVVNA